MAQAIEIVYAATPADWRQWLAQNHSAKSAAWLVFFNKASGKPCLTWSEAVDVALCYGWIDSKKIKVDSETAHQFFSKRKPVSTWSKINKAKVEKLIAEGLVTEAGLSLVEQAKQNGSWTILDSVEELEIPKDLAKAFRANKGAKPFFLSLSKSTRKAMLQWLVLAKRPETRQKRIAEIAEAAARRMKPNAF